MKKINHIKLIFAALPVIIIALLLFIRWNEYGRSYKSLANWGKGLTTSYERDYYYRKIGGIIGKWQQTENLAISNPSKGG